MNESESVVQYLMGKWNNIHNGTAKQTVSGQAGAALKNLAEQIETDKLQIPETARNISRKSPPPEPAQTPDQRLREILHKKEEMMRRLNEMREEESKLKDNTRQSQQQLFKPKSEITAEDIMKLKALNHNYRKFEKQLEKKTKDYEEKQKQFRQEQEELEESHKKEISKAKRDEILTKLEQIRQREQERQAKLAEQQKILAQIRSKKVLYQDWEEKYASQKQLEKKKADQALEEARKLRSTDFDSIKEHKRKYEQMIAKQREERMRRIAEVRKEVQENDKYPQSRFYTIIKEEEIKKQEQEDIKSKYPKLNLGKRREYSQKIKQQILPTLKMRKTEQESQEERLKKKQMRSLSVNELLTKGNEYMQQAKLITKKERQGIPEKKEAVPQPFRYHNYLTEIRSNHSDQEKSELEKLRAIIDKDDIDPDRLFQAKLLAAKMEKSAGNNSRKLMDSIQAKIQILNKLT